MKGSMTIVKPTIAELSKEDAAQVLETPISSIDYAIFMGRTHTEVNNVGQNKGRYVKSDDGEMILCHKYTRKYMYHCCSNTNHIVTRQFHTC